VDLIRTATDYLRALQALLPPGRAFPRTESSVWSGLLSAWAEECARVDARAAGLLQELDPRTAQESIPEWERMLGLPSPCMAGIEQTVEQRRGAILAQLRARGGQSRAYFIDLAAAAGYQITITEFRPCRSNMRSNARTLGSDWRFAWQVNAPAATVWRFRSNSRSGEPLAAWGDELLECLIRRHAPAETIVLFAYGE
jgi:uncharacterized protein YmfQ (DUF2313 family)